MRRSSAGEIPAGRHGLRQSCQLFGRVSQLHLNCLPLGLDDIPGWRRSLQRLPDGEYHGLRVEERVLDCRQDRFVGRFHRHVQPIGAHRTSAQVVVGARIEEERGGDAAVPPQEIAPAQPEPRRQAACLSEDSMPDRALLRRLRQRRELLVGDEARGERNLRSVPAAHAGADAKRMRMEVRQGSALLREHRSSQHRDRERAQHQHAANRVEHRRF
jgi:hypothetical protein